MRAFVLPSMATEKLLPTVWKCDSWDELEQILEETCNELVEDGMIEEAWNWAMEA